MVRLLSPNSHCGRWSVSSDSSGEKKYSPQLWSGSRDVSRILCEGRWYRIDDICGQRIISARRPCRRPVLSGAVLEKDMLHPSASHLTPISLSYSRTAVIHTHRHHP